MQYTVDSALRKTNKKTKHFSAPWKPTKVKLTSHACLETHWQPVGRKNHYSLTIWWVVKDCTKKILLTTGLVTSRLHRCHHLQFAFKMQTLVNYLLEDSTFTLNVKGLWFACIFPSFTAVQQVVSKCLHTSWHLPCKLQVTTVICYWPKQSQGDFLLFLQEHPRTIKIVYFRCTCEKVEHCWTP